MHARRPGPRPARPRPPGRLRPARAPSVRRRTCVRRGVRCLHVRVSRGVPNLRAFLVRGLRALLQLHGDAAEHAVDEARRLVLAAKVLRQLHGLVDGHRNGHVVHVGHFEGGQPQNGAVHDGHACQRPVLGGGRQHAVDLYLVGLHALDQLLGVVRQVAVLGKKPLARGHDAGIGALNFARVQHLQRAAARVRALVSFSHGSPSSRFPGYPANWMPSMYTSTEATCMPTWLATASATAMRTCAASSGSTCP